MNSSQLAANASSLFSGEPISAIVQAHVIASESEGMTPVPTDVSDKPCGEAFSSQTPAAVKLPGSLDALLYIVIVLMFYAFSIVVLMVKYIRREREEASLRNYYHEFVSRDKFRTAQYKHRQFMKGIFNRKDDFDQHTVSSLEDETEPQRRSSPRKKKTQPETTIRNGNTFSRLLVEQDEVERRGKERSFTFLGAKNQFHRNSLLGGKFCNKNLCHKCVSENVPTIDWDDGHGKNNSYSDGLSGKDTIEIKLYQPVQKPPCSILPLGSSGYTADDRLKQRYLSDSDSLFFPIIECESEKELELENQRQANNAGGCSLPYACYERDPLLKETPVEEHAIVSSCSLEVSELLANMPPLGITNSNSNDMDTLDGLSNLDSETESQSLLNYTSSIRCDRDFEPSRLSNSPSVHSDSVYTGRGPDSHAHGHLGTSGKDKVDALSDRTSLLSCSLSFDDGANSVCSNLLTSFNFPEDSLSMNLKKKTEHAKVNGKRSFSPSLSKSTKNGDDEMMRLLNDINILNDENGVFRNLKYFLRGFSKSEVDDASENSNLLPKETYFGPGSPKRMSCSNHVTKNKNCDERDPAQAVRIENFHSDDELLSDDVVNPLGNRWAYTYDDDDDDLNLDGDRSSSFGEYCMGEASESQKIDLSKPLDRRSIDSKVKAGLSRALIGLKDPWLDGVNQQSKPNPLVAGYGPARKETKV